MDKRLITEIEAILARYNGEKWVKNYTDPLGEDEVSDTWGEDEADEAIINGYGFNFHIVTLDDFEENIDWDWVSKNYHVSHAFIYEYQDKLNMQYLYDNYVITKEGFEKIRKREEVEDRFEIMDL